MSTYESPRPALAVALGGADALDVIATPELVERLERLGAAFAIIGADRWHGAEDECQSTIDPSVAAAYLGAESSTLPLVITASTHHDHPWNIARRTASLDHLSTGTSGVVFSHADAGAPGDTAWGGAGLTPGAPLTAETTADAIIAISKLWQTWPWESIIGDREQAIFARAEQIRAAEHHGVFDIAGPSSLPTTPQRTPVIGWYAHRPEDAELVPQAVDLVISASGPAAPDISSLIGQLGTARVYAEVPIDELSSAWDEAVDAQLGGLVIAPSSHGIREVIVRLSDFAAEHPEAFVPQVGSTLRDRLHLTTPADPLTGAAPVFPVTVDVR
jgi:alkanesulfonate monooxygenase SsuD/methylene tetrahydromethanopterin reductase-like flavin-dependent oxidoreductase (luciferase family)